MHALTQHSAARTTGKLTGRQGAMISLSRHQLRHSWHGSGRAQANMAKGRHGPKAGLSVAQGQKGRYARDGKAPRLSMHTLTTQQQAHGAAEQHAHAPSIISALKADGEAQQECYSHALHQPAPHPKAPEYCDR
jgi:hypothetical protein